MTKPTRIVPEAASIAPFATESGCSRRQFRASVGFAARQRRHGPQRNRHRNYVDNVDTLSRVCERRVAALEQRERIT